MFKLHIKLKAIGHSTIIFITVDSLFFLDFLGIFKPQILMFNIVQIFYRLLWWLRETKKPLEKNFSSSIDESLIIIIISRSWLSKIFKIKNPNWMFFGWLIYIRSYSYIQSYHLPLIFIKYITWHLFTKWKWRMHVELKIFFKIFNVYALDM